MQEKRWVQPRVDFDLRIYDDACATCRYVVTFVYNAVMGLREIETTHKELHLEVLRVFAAIGAIYTHTGSYGVTYFVQAADTPMYYFYYICSFFSRFAVPLFWMVTGALLLKKEESLKRLYTHRVLRVVLTLLLFSFFYYIYSGKGNPSFIFSLPYFLKQVYSTNCAPSLWFLYAYTAILIMMPLLRRMAQNMSDREFIYFFAAMLLLRGVLPMAEYAVGQGAVTVNHDFPDKLFINETVFLLMGYFLENRITEQGLTKKTALLMAVAAVAATCLICTTDMLSDNAPPYYGFVFVPAAALFYCLRFLFSRINVSSGMTEVIMFFGSISFGAMLFEHFMRRELFPLYSALLNIVPAYSACVLWVLLAFICGGAVTAVLKKIPVIKKLL